MSGQMACSVKESELLDKAVWIAHSLFERGKTAGSSANMSFLYEGRIYITASGTCFGTLSREDFAIVDLQTLEVCNGRKPSKELPLHRIMYQKNPAVAAVIHTHSFYSVLMSCLAGECERVIPKYTPYLDMKVGPVGIIPYAKPGSEELFALFEKGADRKLGYLLRNHGAVVGGEDLMAAFYNIEELEESAKVAWHLKDLGIKELD